MEGKHVGSFAADVEGTGEGRCAEGEGEGSAGTDRDLGLKGNSLTTCSVTARKQLIQFFNGKMLD